MKQSTLASCLIPLSVLCCGDDSCFVEGTLIDTPSGPVAIEDLMVGDLVFSYSLEQRGSSLSDASARSSGARRVRCA